MFALQPNSYELIRPLLLGMDIHLIGRSILAHKTPAQIFVDDPNQPRSLFAQAGHRYILAGDAVNEEFNRSVNRQFADIILPHAHEAGLDGFVIYYDTPSWEEKMNSLIQGKKLIHAEREYYACWELKKN